VKPLSPELIIVMPVYNEQASVRKVVMEWFQEIENWTENFVFLAIDDGSKDESLKILERLQTQLGPRLEILSRENRGHGQSCLQAYREALSRGIPWIMQIDSDGQCDPQYFFKMWRLRKDHDVIYGRRASRDDGWRRVVASHVLRFTLLATCGVYCVDANVPYRMIRSEVLQGLLDRIPSDFFLANVGLAVLLKKDPKVREGKVRIHFRERYGGEPSVALSKFGTKAGELVRQLSSL
jgi:dolichol-phosphate mannosyltransferase